MKRAEDMSAEELLSLDEAAINTLVDIELMVDGVQTVQPAGPEPALGTDLVKTGYYIMTGTVLYPSMEAAEQALALSCGTRDYESLNNIYSRGTKKATVQVEQLYQLKDLQNIKAERESFEKKYRLWGSKDSDYRNYCHNRDKAEKVVYDCINNARETTGKLQDLKAQYDQYLKLAGDEEVALRFFRDLLTKQGYDVEATVTKVLGKVESKAEE